MSDCIHVIGVACNPGEEPFVQEFFECFKTPWEFYREDHAYSVVVSTRALKEVRAGLFLLYGSDPLDDAVLGSVPSAASGSTYLEYEDLVFPIYGKTLTFDSAGPAFIRHRGNRAAAAFEQTRSAQKVLRIGYDLFQEVRVLLTLGQPVDNALTPTLEVHIWILRNAILAAGIPLVEIPATPSGHEFIACLTHDVDFVRIRDHKLDHTMWGFIYRASVGSMLSLAKGEMSWRRFLENVKALLLLPFVYLGICEDFWLQDFERFLALEGDLKSTYFFIPFRDRPGEKVARHRSKRRAAAYDVAEEVPLIQKLARQGNEIGVHGIDAWHDSGKGREEHRRIADAGGSSVLGIRMHWLCFNAESPRVLEDAGFHYDSTFGYNETVGYRAGTLQVFRPEGTTTLLELPLHLQDTALFYSGRMGLTENQSWKLCEVLANNAVKYGGVLTVLWHTRSLAPERLWGDFYVRLLNSLRIRRPWFATASQVVDWFRNRRAFSFQEIDIAGERVRVVMKYGGRMAEQPNMTLRFHVPNREAAVSGGRRFVDIPWTGQPVIEVPVG